MKRMWLCLMWLAGSSALQLGCGTACEQANERISSRYEECGFKSNGIPQDSGSTECSAAYGTYRHCFADCAESASCESLHGTDAEGAADFSRCIADCQ
jgi:hypothetical protein